jgi:hypothetical protein
MGKLVNEHSKKLKAIVRLSASCAKSVEEEIKMGLLMTTRHARPQLMRRASHASLVEMASYALGARAEMKATVY